MVELLVVIAIIAILMATVFPLASSALARSRAAACKHHIRQAGGTLLALSSGENRLGLYDMSIGSVSGGTITLPCGCKVPAPDVLVAGSAPVMDGCADAPPNPLYMLDPKNQPKRLSYGILAYNQGVPKSSAWPWYLACSEYTSIRAPGDVAPRHRGKASIFHLEGHVTESAPEDLEFPENGP